MGIFSASFIQLQCVPFEITERIAVALYLYILDPLVIKPKCAWEIVVLKIYEWTAERYT